MIDISGCGPGACGGASENYAYRRLIRMDAMLQTVGTLVGELYGCLLHERPESRALDLLCSAVGARHAVVMRTGQTTGRSIATSHHLSANDLAGLDGISASAEYGQVLANSREGPFSRMTALISRRQLARSDIYQHALRPLDGGLAAFGVRVDGDDLVISNFCRSLSSDRDFDDDALIVLGLCLPHLVAVATLASRMARERCVNQSAFDALNIVQDGVIMVGGHGTVTYANAAAEATLARGDRLRRWQNGILANAPSDDRKLQQTIQAARMMRAGSTTHSWTTDTSPLPKVVLGKHRPGWPLVVTVFPAHQAILGGCDPRDVMLHLVDSANAFCLPPRVLRDEFGLTAREADLTWQLAQGATLPESARMLEISAGTARQYLKIIFNKVGVSSQSELLRVVRH